MKPKTNPDKENKEWAERHKGYVNLLITEAKRQTAEDIFKDLDNLVWGKEPSWSLSQWNAVKQKYLQNHSPQTKQVGRTNDDSSSSQFDKTADNQERDSKEAFLPKTCFKESRPDVCETCGLTKEKHINSKVYKKSGINKGQLKEEFFWCYANKQDFNQYKKKEGKK